MPSEVAEVLGIAGNDLDAVCTSNNINMWAKFKPVVYASVATLTDAQRAAANYGIHNIPTWGLVQHGSVVTMMAFWLQGYKIEQNAPDCGVQPVYWSYLKPSGGVQSPYRLSDFAKNTVLGYFHGAVAPIAPIANPTIEISPAGHLSIVYVNGAQSDMTLKYSDLTLETGGQIPISGFYFGVALIRKADVSQSSATRYVQTDMTAADSISQGAHVHTNFENSAAIASFMGQADRTVFYVMSFFANGEMYDTFTRTSGGTTTTYRKFLTSFGTVTANQFVALLERQEVTIVRKYADVVVERLVSARRSGTNIIDTDWEVFNNMTDYPVTVTKMSIEYLDSIGQVIVTDVITTSYNIDSLHSANGRSSHNFGQAGTGNVYSARMTINTLEGVISFNPNESVKVVVVN